MNTFGINAIQIENESDKSKYYGKNVIGYTPQNGSTVGWKIFFADKNNIYLIADDYVEPNKLPASIKEDGTITQNTPKITGSSFPRSASFANIISDYSTGAKRIKNNYPIEIQQLNKSYFDQGFTSKNGDINVMYVYYDGFVDSGSYLWGDLGFRPVVCLNSYVELQKKDNGFCIKE